MLDKILLICLLIYKNFPEISSGPSTKSTAPSGNRTSSLPNAFKLSLSSLTRVATNPLLTQIRRLQYDVYYSRFKMTDALMLIDEILIWKEGQFEAHIKVYRVAKSFKFPEGIKTRCALVERRTGTLHLLLDNHAPFGYHLHSKLPKNRNFRELINVRSHLEAIEIFHRKCERIVNEKIR